MPAATLLARVSGLEQRALLMPPGHDGLPEYTSYDDTGCDVQPSCLTCPLVRCRYDDPCLPLSERNRSREREPQNVSVNTIAGTE